MAKRYKQSLPLLNLAATRVPQSNDDSSRGYDVGSQWGFQGKLWRCDNATQYVAVWTPIGSVPVFTSNIVVSLSGGKRLGPYSDGQTIPLAGLTMQQGFELIARETQFPTLTAPSASLTLSGTGYASMLEVGFTIFNFMANASFSRGLINPQYSALENLRSGLPTNYTYTGVTSDSNVPNVITPLIDSSSANNIIVTPGTNAVTVVVNHNAGVQPKDSAMNNYDIPLAIGTKSATASFQGIYPYFFGKVTSVTPAGVGRPIANQALINSGTKVIGSSSGTITINFASTPSDYIWFAIPSNLPSVAKTKWYISDFSRGDIGGGVSAGGNLFPIFDILSVTAVLWAGISYNVYISNYQTEATIVELRNS